jgi:hypothetical protein
METYASLEDNIKPDIQYIRKVHGCRLAASRFCESGNETPGSTKGRDIT